MKIMEYKSETKNCQNCKNDFIIEPDDFGFYEKIGVLPPKICPDCRSQLRLAFRNERYFYKRICDHCKKDIISMYSANKPFPVWCHDCWWGDEFDGRNWAMVYNPDKPFMEQLQELWIKVPKLSLVYMRGVNSPYLNFSADQKNSYMVIESSNCENCTNCYWIQLSKDLTDCSFTNQVELSYEVNDTYNSSGLCWCKGAHNCLDSAFLLDCRNCINCLGCINLVGQKYHIFNKSYSKEEYENRVKSYRLDTHSGVEAFKKKFEDFIKDKPRKFAEIVSSVNSTGNYLNNVRNSRECFHSYEGENNAYCHHAFRGAKDCQDCNTVGRASELVYNSLNMGIETARIICSSVCWGSHLMTYCVNCPSSSNCFGSIGIRNKSYCILNKEYSKEEYEKLCNKIITELKIAGTYGDFFPKNFSAIGYNESSAFEEFPLLKEEALARGFNWEDTERGTYGKETISWESFPDSICDLPKTFDVNSEVFVCMNCEKNYRLISDELAFYCRLKIPIPRTCPECRHIARVIARGPNKLWHRECMCEKDNHHNHKDKCEVKFETSYAPDRPEIIYCEKCYQSEVY